MPAGQPTSYKEEYCALATNYCLLGATDVQLAEYFGVSVTTINTWKETHPKFLLSIKAGKEDADAQIAQSLFQRALGYSHKDIDIRVVDQKIVLTQITKHYPPETKAAIFWLKNRQKTLWRDIQQITGADEKPLIPERSAEDDMDIVRKLAFVLAKNVANEAIEKASEESLS